MDEVVVIQDVQTIYIYSDTRAAMPKITSSHYQRISENTRCVAQLAKLLSKSIYPNLNAERITFLASILDVWKIREDGIQNYRGSGVKTDFEMLN